MKRMMILFSLVLALTVALTTCALAAGRPIQNLKGEFAIIETNSCVRGDFTADPQFQLLTNGATSVTQLEGLLTLFGDGTGSFGCQAVTIRNDAVEVNQYPVLGYVAGCDVTYQNTEVEGEIEIRFKNCEGNYRVGLFGPATLLGSYSDIVVFAKLSPDGNTLLYHGLKPYIEYTWITIPNNGTINLKQICSRTGTAIRIR